MFKLNIQKKQAKSIASTNDTNNNYTQIRIAYIQIPRTRRPTKQVQIPKRYERQLPPLSPGSLSYQGHTDQTPENVKSCPQEFFQKYVKTWGAHFSPFKIWIENMQRIKIPRTSAAPHYLSAEEPTRSHIPKLTFEIKI